MDYFDKLKAAGHPTEIRTLSIDVLWGRRFILFAPHKRQRAKPFFDSFEDLIRLAHNGTRLANGAIEAHPYWDFLGCYHESWRAVPLSGRARRQKHARVRDGLKLYESLRDEGMRDPLGMIVYADGQVLYRGLRRLTILHVLGTNEAKVECVFPGISTKFGLD